MASKDLSIGELAHELGLTRRAVRFYVQQGLLQPPEGRGRGSSYGREHVERLKTVLDLQQAGHSLEAIRKILGGKAIKPPGPTKRVLPRISLKAELWTRLRVMEGVELQYNASRHNPPVEKLLKLKEIIADVIEEED